MYMSNSHNVIVTMDSIMIDQLNNELLNKSTYILLLF